MKTMEDRLLEKIAATEEENTKLKEQLDITEDAINFLIMNGGVGDA